MKKALFTHLFIVIISLLGCAGEKPYVKSPKPPPPNAIALPGVEKGKLPKPYEVNGERYYPLPDAEGFVETGKASWYGPEFQGRPTASGEVLDMYKRTAAHKTLPLATVVKVINLSNNK
jgi:rare lipoprotein A